MRKLLAVLLFVPAIALANEDSILKWDPVANAVEYHVQRKAEGCGLPDGAPWVDIGGGPVLHPTTTYTDPNVAGGLTVCYRVSASLAGRTHESGWSNRGEKLVPLSAPANFGVQ